jgi:hypothetical protein
MTRCGGVEMSAEGEAAMEREKGGDNVSWVDANFTGPKNEKNPRYQFSCFKWTEKI